MCRIARTAALLAGICVTIPTFAQGPRIVYDSWDHDFGARRNEKLRSSWTTLGVNWLRGLRLYRLQSRGPHEAGIRIERFDRDPGWEGRNHRSDQPPARTVNQDFGFSQTRRAGGQAAGEIGGVLTPASEPSYYARVIEPKTFDDKLSASGVFACDAGPVHALVGFFNAKTINEWRTPNTIALRVQGRGDRFFAYVEYASSRWRAGGDGPRPFARVRDPKTGKEEPKGFAARGMSHTWSLTYDPAGNDGGGVISAMIDGETSICHLDAGHKADGASFDRFGLLGVSKSADTSGELWLDDVTIDGQRESFDRDPEWEGFQNRRTYTSRNVRPRFDFGYSASHFARGLATGELGGLIFRGDCREADRMACYGDRVGPLTLDRPLRASGKVVLRRAVSDSTTLFGFYHSGRSMAVNPSQSSGLPENFLGFAVEGPSREGFFVYPAYRTTGDREGSRTGPDRPHILPDGTPHDWTLEYAPNGADGRGRITLTLDQQSVSLDLQSGDRASGATFDRFGLVTTWIDGNGQSIYFDDLSYTAAQD